MFLLLGIESCFMCFFQVFIFFAVSLLELGEALYVCFIEVFKLLIEVFLCV